MSNPSLPEKPKSLADEIMGMIERYGDQRWANAWESTQAAESILRSRLLAIESELNDLRKVAETAPGVMLMRFEESLPSEGNPVPFYAQTSWLVYADKDAVDKLNLKDRTPVPPRVESHNTLVNQLTAHSQAIGEYGPPLEQPPELPVENDLGISEDDGN